MTALGLAETVSETGFTLWAPLHRAVQLLREGEVVDLDVQVEGPDRQIWEIGCTQLIAQRRGAGWTINGTPMPNTHSVIVIRVISSAANDDFTSERDTSVVDG